MGFTSTNEINTPMLTRTHTYMPLNYQDAYTDSSTWHDNDVLNGISSKSSK